MKKALLFGLLLVSISRIHGMEQKASRELHWNQTEINQLLKAIEEKNANTAKIILESGLDPNADIGGIDVLPYTLENGASDFKTVKVVIDYGADVYGIDPWTTEDFEEIDFRPLILAVKHYNTNPEYKKIVKYILQKMLFTMTPEQKERAKTLLLSLQRLEGQRKIPKQQRDIKIKIIVKDIIRENSEKIMTLINKGNYGEDLKQILIKELNMLRNQPDLVIWRKKILPRLTQ